MSASLDIIAARSLRACAIMLGVSLASLGAGCGSTPRPAAAASSGVIQSRDVFRAGPRREVVATADGTRVQQRSATSVDDQGRWTLQLHGAARTVAKSELLAGRTLTFERDASGKVALVSLVDHEKGRITRFKPALALMPSELAGAAVHESASQLEVSDVRDPGKVIETGTARATSRLIESEVGTRCVESVMKFEFSAAKVEQGRRFTLSVTGPAPALIQEEEWLTVKVGILTLTRTRDVWHPAADQ